MKTTDTQNQIAESFKGIRSPDGDGSFNFLVGYLGASIACGDFSDQAAEKLLRAFTHSVKAAEDWEVRKKAKLEALK
jgi:hypothetical protein